MHRHPGLRLRPGQGQMKTMRSIGRKNLGNQSKVMDIRNSQMNQLGINVSTHTHTNILTL